MAPPEPKKGLVIQYEYEWNGAQKSRPCLIVYVAKTHGEALVRVYVLPITSAQEADEEATALEIPANICRALGLPKRSWLRTDHRNDFQWPFDVKDVPSGPKKGKSSYGFMPAGFYRSAIRRLARNLDGSQHTAVRREDTDLSDPKLRKGKRPT